MLSIVYILFVTCYYEAGWRVAPSCSFAAQPCCLLTCLALWLGLLPASRLAGPGGRGGAGRAWQLGRGGQGEVGRCCTLHSTEVTWTGYTVHTTGRAY